MKRTACAPLTRQHCPDTLQTSHQVSSTSNNNALQAKGRLAHARLRDLPVPPFPPDVNFSTCAIAA